MIAGLLVATLGWVTWHLGGVMGESMGVGFALAMMMVPLVWARWLWLEPTGLPRGWWWPLPMVAYMGWHAWSLSATPGRATMEALHGLWGLAGYWVALHVVRLKEPRRWVGAGVGGLTLLLAVMAFYQRVVDPTWLPMGRVQGIYFQTRSSGLFGVPNTLAAWMLVVIPSAWWLVWRNSRQRPAWALAAGVVASAASAGLVLTLSRGGWLAMFLALVIWGVVGLSGGWRRRVSWAVLVLVLFGGALGWGYVKLPQLRDRLDTMVKFRGERTRPMMWEAAGKLWLDAPWWGTGGGSYHSLVDRHRPVGFRDAPQWAHNDYLNTLSDYGVVGMVLGWGIFGWVVWQTQRRHREQRRREQAEKGRQASDSAWKTAIGVGLCGGLLATAVDFHLHLPALLWLMILLLAEWTHGRRRGDPGPRKANVAVSSALRGSALLVVTVGALGLGWWSWPRFQAEALRFQAQEQIDGFAKRTPLAPSQADLAPVLEALVRATQLAPEHEAGWNQLAMAMALRAHAERAHTAQIGREAEAAARRALALSPEVAMHWVSLGVALDLQGKWAEAGLVFGRAIKMAPTNARVWFYQGFHFSHKTSTHALARAALATCLRLDGGIPQAKTLLSTLKRSP